MVTALRYINNVPHLDILTGALLNADVFLCSKIKQFLIHLFIVNAKFKIDERLIFSSAIAIVSLFAVEEGIKIYVVVLGGIHSQKQS
ncbi:unnamed protein product [Rotaria sordida]|uniref:Uncharacterized protein n=1 Tax=Rotaria sordida TaxID=392033 RepID=A0A814QB65_9BILA|nr:unnamed protein product [Rotaria sordida]CAF1332368.1 unnamed protein product [Rotaria sordida]